MGGGHVNMYDEIGYLGPHDNNAHHLHHHHHMLVASIGPGPSSALSTIGIPGGFSHEAISGFDPKHELSTELLQQCTNFKQCFSNPSPDPSMLPIPSISFNYPNKRAVNFQAPADMYDDPMVHVNLPDQSSLLRDVLHSMPHEYGSGLVGPFNEGMDEGYMGECALNPVFGLWREMSGSGKGEEPKGSNNAEKQRRGQMSEKFTALKALIPNPTKPDRASITSDASDYIKELLRTVEELKTLVHRKRLRGDRNKKRVKGEEEEEEVAMDKDTSSPKLTGERDTCCSVAGLLRSSWLQRRTKDTFVDVRIVEDEVNIKLTQRKKPGCLLFVAKVLQELQLELLHMASGNIGDYLIFMINTKIYEGSTVYASGIAKKFIEAMNMQYPMFAG